MGDLTRTFVIPLHQPRCQAGDEANSSDADSLDIVLHEPALSEDNLGLKTWAASYLLAKRLSLVKDQLPSRNANTPILELGAGTGLVGLAASAIFGSQMLLTDLPAIVPNLHRNVQVNASTTAQYGGSAQVAVLDWSNPAELTYGNPPAPAEPHSFELILAADPIYSPSHPEMLVNTIAHHLRLGESARVVIELPLREAFQRERDDLRQRLIGVDLRLLAEGTEIGYDDWGSADGEGLAEVECWWGLWGWEGPDEVQRID
jgi:predicted nicotinamide N-methyase